MFYTKLIRPVLALSWCILQMTSASAQSTTLWTQQIGGLDDDYGNSLAVDKAGNIYAGGGYLGSSQAGSVTLPNLVANTDAYFAKYNSHGVLEWARQLSTANPNGHSVLNSLATDARGNVWLAGQFKADAQFGPIGLSAGNQNAAFIAKYDARGQALWARRISPTVATADASMCLAVTPAGESVVAGFVGANPFVAKYDSLGALRWWREGRVAGTGQSWATGVAVDSAGTVWVTGHFSNSPLTFGTQTVQSAGNRDMFVANYDDQGNLRWVQRAGGSGGDEGRSIVADNRGGAYLTGSFAQTATFGTTTLAGVAGQSSGFVARYSAQGTVEWVQAISASRGASGRSLVVEASGKLCVSGSYGGKATLGNTVLNAPSTNNAVFVARFTDQGQAVGAKSIGGTGMTNCQSLALSPAGTPLVTGSFAGVLEGENGQRLTSRGNLDVYISKVEISAVALATQANATLSKELAVYPNPSAGAAELQVSFASTATELRLINALGQVVRTQPLVSRTSSATLPVTGLAAGGYVLQVLSAEGVATRSVVVQ
jgi:hypothetical protein